MKKASAILLCLTALFSAGPALHAQAVSCSGTIMSWMLTNPAYGSKCNCSNGESSMPVCTSGGGGNNSLTFGNNNYGRVLLVGPDTGEPFVNFLWQNRFSDFNKDANLRWQLKAWRIMHGLSTEDVTFGERLIEMFCRWMSCAAADTISGLDGASVSNETAAFERLMLLMSKEARPDSVKNSPDAFTDASVCVGGKILPVTSVPPSYSMFYRSSSGQAESNAQKLQRFPDGRVVFTDADNVLWAFRPNALAITDKGDYHYRSPVGSPYRLVFGEVFGHDRGYRVETPDGDAIEFSSAPTADQWRPSRYNAADGSWLTYDYGPNGLARITDMHGRYFAFDRNAQGLPLAVSDQNGKKTAFVYDAQGRVIAVTSPDGFKKTFDYNTAGLLSSVKDGSLASERYTYDSSGRVLSSEGEGGVNRLEHYYNDAASKTVITDGLGNKTGYSYVTEYGRKLTTAVTDALGNTVYLGYDADYNVAVTTDTLGHVTRYVRNSNGDPLAITDALGNTSTIQYQVKANYWDASVEKTDYYSRPIKITDALGRATKLDYDSYGNLAVAEDALGNKTRMDYDNAGHMLVMRDAAGATYKYEYNMGLAKSIDPLGRVTSYKRDADQRVTQFVDPLGRSTTFMYDLNGNVTEVRNPADFVTKFKYGNGACPSCGGSQLSALTDPKGNTWNFSYDQYGRLTNTTNPLGQAKVYNYDKMSRVAEVKDPAGNITSYTYDALNRLTKKEIQTPAGIYAATSYAYDAVGNLLSATNSDSTVEYAYDALNRPIETKQTFAGKTYPISYTYDVVGNRTSMGTPWGKYSYTYDALNRVSAIVNPQGIQINFKYDAVGRRIQKTIFASTLNSLPVAETSYSYDTAGQLLNITNKAGGKVVSFDNYTYDELGNRVRIEDQNGVKVYGYDKSNRLITVKPLPFNMAEAEAFVYDKNGNRRFDREAKDYKYDAANRVIENTIYNYAHDLLGNLTNRMEKVSSATITYAYNPEHQLSDVLTPARIKVGYKYDPLGRRTERTVNSVPVYYVYDGQDIIAELDNSGAPINTYTNGPGIDEPLVMSKSESSAYFYHSDALGSINVLTDEKNVVIETYNYKSYGQPTIKNANGQLLDQSTIGNTRLFTAREYERETGLYNNRHRWLDPKRGAFTQEDPIGFGGGETDLYVYSTDNPVLFIDSLGLEFITTKEGVRIADEAATWVYTPYVSPGNKKGVGADCSGATNQIYINAGFKYVNTGSKGISTVPELKPVPGNIPQIGDIGWWKGHVAIYDPRLQAEDLNIWTAFHKGKDYGKGNTSWWGDAKWYRYYQPDKQEISVVQSIINKLRELMK